MREEGDEILEGALVCPEHRCRREHPIIDGIPIIVADIRSYVGHQLAAIGSRRDLSWFMEGLLGDCAGPDSDFDRIRSELSTYGRSHYGDLDPDEPADREGSLLNLLESSLALLSRPPAGLWLDTGCAVGRSTLEVASITGDLALGIDLNFSMLRLARQIARGGRVVHPLRRVGLVYDRREFSVDLPSGDLVDFWACDAAVLPFAEGHFDGVLSLNLVDCSASPLDVLSETGRVLRTSAECVITTPYDWSPRATPVEAWIGGHSQRGETQGRSVDEMRRLLSAEAPVPTGLRLVKETDSLPWQLYIHERATMTYRVHLAIARADR